MLNLIYCDTGAHHIEEIEAFLKIYENSGLSVRGFGRVGEFMNYMDHYGESVDIVLANISLGNISGIKIMKLIQERLPEIQVIFLSDYPDMVFDAYAVRHIAYITFPIIGERLHYAINMAAAYAGGSKKQYISLASKGVISRIDVDNILYIESNLRNIIIHTNDRVMIFPGKIEGIKEKLDGRFIQCHKSFLVNMTYIAELSCESAMLSNGESVPVSNRRFKETKDGFISYSGDSYYDPYRS